MKPFMGFNLTLNKKNDEANGNEWLVQTTSAAISQSVENAIDRSMETMDKSELPLAVRIIKGVCGFGGLLIALGVLDSLLDEDAIPLAQAYQNAPWLFWLGGICLVVWGVLQIMGMKKQKEVLDSEESTQIFSSVDGSLQAAFTELGVPGDAREVDVLCFQYKEKNGQIKAHESAWSIAPYTTMIYRLFSDEETIYLANADGKYAFPRSAILSIETINKTIRTDSWNKDEPYHKGQYKQYKITTDKFECPQFKPYHILHLTRDGEEWGIYFPCYELPAFEAATGLKAE